MFTLHRTTSQVDLYQQPVGTSHCTMLHLLGVAVLGWFHHTPVQAPVAGRSTGYRCFGLVLLGWQVFVQLEQQRAWCFASVGVWRKGWACGCCEVASPAVYLMHSGSWAPHYRGYYFHSVPKFWGTYNNAGQYIQGC